MTVDVAIVSFRSGPLVASAVRQARTLAPQAEVFVVNNDQHDEAAARAARECGATLIANRGNRGFAAAVNQAIAAGNGDLVLLLNPDVTQISGEWSALERIFANDRRVGAVAVRIVDHVGDLQRTCRREPGVFDFLSETLGLPERFATWSRPKQFRMLDWSYTDERVVDAACGAFLVIRREALVDVGLFDERFFVYTEELDFLIRAKRRGWRTYFTPAVSVVHRAGGSTGSSRSYLSLLLLDSWYEYARKHFGLGKAAALRGMLLGFDLVRLPRAVMRRPGPGTSPAALAARIRVHLGGDVRPERSAAPPILRGGPS
jgi:N-acetylglucosaminyl-diphospho-decaprenol L-rhamnosyltransferase